MNEDDDLDFEPWTREGAERLRGAAVVVAAEIVRHAERVATLNGDSGFAEQWDASKQLLVALTAYADA